MAEKKSIWTLGLTAVAAALFATLGLRFLALLVIDVPAEFPPLAGIAPTIFFTTVSSIAAVGVYALVRRTSDRADTVFRWIALVVLLVSFVPDFLLLSEGASEAFPGATPAGAGVLMAMHVAAAAAIVGVLTTGARD